MCNTKDVDSCLAHYEIIDHPTKKPKSDEKLRKYRKIETKYDVDKQPAS